MLFETKGENDVYEMAKIDNQLSIRNSKLKICNNAFNDEWNIWYWALTICKRFWYNRLLLIDLNSVIVK